MEPATSYPCNRAGLANTRMEPTRPAVSCDHVATQRAAHSETLGRNEGSQLPNSVLGAGLCGLLLLAACSQRKQEPGQAGPKTPMLLPQGVYLSAIDASLRRISPGTKRVWISSASPQPRLLGRA